MHPFAFYGRKWGGFFALLFWLNPFTILAQNSSAWEQVIEKDGIRVTKRDVPGRQLPTFRGIGEVRARLLEVLAVINDPQRFSEWMHRTAESRLIKQKGEWQFLVYTLTQAPWPVSNREAVLRFSTTISANGTEAKVKFKALKSYPMKKKSGAVWMEQLEGHYQLKEMGKGLTRVEYLVNADLGGALPSWIAKRAAKSLPLKTLINLRRQVKKTRTWYRERIKRWQDLSRGRNGR